MTFIPEQLEVTEQPHGQMFTLTDNSQDALLQVYTNTLQANQTRAEQKLYKLFQWKVQSLITTMESAEICINGVIKQHVATSCSFRSESTGRCDRHSAQHDLLKI